MELWAPFFGFVQAQLCSFYLWNSIWRFSVFPSLCHGDFKINLLISKSFVKKIYFIYFKIRVMAWGVGGREKEKERRDSIPHRSTPQRGTKIKAGHVGSQEQRGPFGSPIWEGPSSVDFTGLFTGTWVRNGAAILQTKIHKWCKLSRQWFFSCKAEAPPPINQSFIMIRNVSDMSKYLN